MFSRRDIQTSQIQVIFIRQITDSCLPCAGFAVDTFAHPFQGAAVFAESGPQELAIAALAEPVHVENLRGFALQFIAHIKPVLEIIAHVVAAERQHGKRVVTYPTLSRMAAVGSEAAVAPIKTPWSQSNASVTSGTTAGTASAEDDDIDRQSFRFFPVGRNNGTLRCRSGKTRIAMSGWLFIGRCPVTGLSSQSGEWAVLPSLPTRYPRRRLKRSW